MYDPTNPQGQPSQQPNPNPYQQPASQPYQQPQPYPQPPLQQPCGPMVAQSAENVGKGLVGAFVGSLIGVVAIIVLSRLNIVSALAGLAMSFCALRGYEKLAGSVSKKGVVACAVLLVVMVFVADYIDWAIVVASELDVSVFDALPYIFDLIDMGAIDSAGYFGNLALLYLFTALGAVPVVADAFKSR